MNGQAHIKESLTNYYLPPLTNSSVSVESTVVDANTEVVDTESSSTTAGSGFAFEEYSRTFEIVKQLGGDWKIHRFDENPWSDYCKPYSRLEDEEDLEVEEIHAEGILSSTVIGNCLSYLDRSPEDLHHVLCKCILSNKQLTDVSELRYYHYLQYLDLSWNELTTLAPLGQLPFLQYLDVSHNYLQELLDFKAPYFLTFVNYSHNLVNCIPDLTQFWSITHLNLSYNRVVQIIGLENLRGVKERSPWDPKDELKETVDTGWAEKDSSILRKRDEFVEGGFLSYLDLSWNEINKLENLDGLRIQHLILHHNSIANTAGDGTTKFKTLNYIRSVDLSYNKITSLRFFENADNIENIDVSNNNISSLLEIYYLQNLRYLSRLNLCKNPIHTMRFYINVCLTTIKNLMVLDGKEVTAEQRIEAEKSANVDPSLPARESRIELVLLQQVNKPYIGPHIMPYDQPPPMVIILVGPPSSMKGNTVTAFCASNENLVRGVSYTTRPKVNNEISGKDYYFVHPNEFKFLTRKGHFIAVSEFNGYSYGIANEELQKGMNKVIVFHSDVNSALSLRIMGINPRLVLALPRDENTHSRWIRSKYYYNRV
ncbi:hypothetical protein NQ318_005613 [Aromia moschata]|uniref:Guanylate kinase-like domain-containing protein n=1 Tax=Aromia moschata TaxID=1265417 RepID=A0AAV8XV08_9CUCU|nr:hypothetical protein NQ318_005613 [Aromia moschata]